MVALNDTILRNILGDGKGPKRDWVSRSKETDAADALEYEKSKAAEEKEKKGILKGLKTYAAKEGTSKPIGSTEYTATPETEKIVSGLETYDNPKVKLDGQKFTMANYMDKPKIKPVPYDALKLIDPNKTRFPAEWKETDAARPFGEKAKEAGTTFLKNVKSTLPEFENKFKRKTPIALSPEEYKKQLATDSNIKAEENKLLALRATGLESREKIAKYQKKIADSQPEQFAGLKRFATGISSNLSGGMGSSIIGSFQDPRSTKEYNLARLALQGYQRYLMKSKKAASWEEAQANLLPNEAVKLEKLTERVQRAQQNVASSGFAGRGGGQLALMGSSRPISIQRFTAIGPTAANVGSYGPEAMARLGVGQSLGALHPINKVRAFGWGGGSSIPGLLGTTEPLMPTDRVAAFTKMNFRADKISGLLGKSPSPAVDIKSKMRRIMKMKY